MLLNGMIINWRPMYEEMKMMEHDKFVLRDSSLDAQTHWHYAYLILVMMGKAASIALVENIKIESFAHDEIAMFYDLRLGDIHVGDFVDYRPRLKYLVDGFAKDFKLLVDEWKKQAMAKK